MPTPSTVVAIYCRISSDASGVGANVAIQEKDCRALAKKEGWSVGAVYVDNDESAYKRKKPRPGYTQMLDAVRAGTYQHILAYHPTRLLRSNRELEDLCDIVDQTGCRISFVQAPDYDLKTANGRLIARILASVARGESELMSERIRRKIAEMVVDGRPGGGVRCFGYEADKVTINEAEAALVRDAARRILRRGETLSDIVREWNDQSVPTIRGAKQWSITALRSLLTNPRLAGLRTHRGEIVGEAVWPAILKRSEWEQLRAKLTDPGRRTNANSRSYLLTGLLRCSLCGTVMVSFPRQRKVGRHSIKGEGNPIKAYGCKKASGGCGGVHCLAQPVDELVTEMVLQRLSSKAYRRSLLRKDESVDRNIVAELQAQERKLDECDDDYAAGTLERRAWLRMRGKITDRVTQLREELASVSKTRVLTELGGKDIGEKWPELSVAQRNLLVRALIEEITIYPATGVRNQFNPERVGDPTWRS